MCAQRTARPCAAGTRPGASAPSIKNDPLPSLVRAPFPLGKSSTKKLPPLLAPALGAPQLAPRSASSAVVRSVSQLRLRRPPLPGLSASHTQWYSGSATSITCTYKRRRSPPSAPRPPRRAAPRPSLSAPCSPPVARALILPQSWTAMQLFTMWLFHAPCCAPRPISPRPPAAPPFSAPALRKPLP
ncbi:hypothetical protein DFH09DRAFT_1311780 [Mycena vulgaris]|nr:hypothetical protein DFH09DRAFT_1311780 [Mycena vulgaris]